MLAWLKSLTLGASVPSEAPQHQLNEKIRVRSKASPIAKTTSVNVAADEPGSGAHVSHDKLAATVVLSIELSKQPLWSPGYSTPGLSISSSTATESIRSSEFSWNPTKPLLWMPAVKGKRSTEIRSMYQHSKASAASLSVNVSATGSTVGVLDDENRTIADNDTDIMGTQRHPASAAARLLQQHMMTYGACDSELSDKQQCLERRQSDIVVDPIPVQRKELEPPSLQHSRTTGNVVLPAFSSEFSKPTSTDPPVETSPCSLMATAMKTITSLCVSKDSHLLRPNPLCDTFDSLYKLKQFFGDLHHGAEKRIVVVGIHGWFPAKIVRSMIGEPTGTSRKFCEQMSIAIKQYMLDEHGIHLPEDAITAIPLEHEGKVEDRVNHLYHKLVDNIHWLEAISAADVLLWGTHSQGTPVTAMLLCRLLGRGLIHPKRQSICMLAMAGIAHGPFPLLKDNLIVKYFEADAARELFEFMDSENSVSMKFRESLAYILRQGVKLVLVGSMQDQVVPLHSAIMSSISHPNILRAIYIDRHSYDQDDFLINLIVFVLRLRNAGFCDRGLLENISEVLAGSLYAREGGHSTIYEEVNVYLLAVRYLFETSPIGVLEKAHQVNPNPFMAADDSTQQTPRLERFQAKDRTNPFHLPWILRGIFDDPAINSHPVFQPELARLQKLFMSWKPVDTRMREIKFRLEPLQNHVLHMDA